MNYPPKPYSYMQNGGGNYTPNPAFGATMPAPSNNIGDMTYQDPHPTYQLQPAPMIGPPAQAPYQPQQPQPKPQPQYWGKPPYGAGQGMYPQPPMKMPQYGGPPGTMPTNPQNPRQPRALSELLGGGNQFMPFR